MYIYKYFFISTGDTGTVRVSQMLKFITGLEQVPPLGLPDQIIVKFKYFCSANCQCRPTASTCDSSITFPLHYDNYCMTSYVKLSKVENQVGSQPHQSLDSMDCLVL